MPEENQIPIGFDIPRLEAEKEQILRIFRQLFNELEQYDKKNITPINITGLTELNTVMKSTGDQITTLNSIIADLNTTLNKADTAAERTIRTYRLRSDADKKSAENTEAKNRATQKEIELNERLAKSNEQVAKSSVTVQQPRQTASATTQQQRAAGVSVAGGVSVIQQQQSANAVNPTQFVAQRKANIDAEKAEVAAINQLIQVKNAEAVVDAQIIALESKLLQLGVEQSKEKAELTVQIRELKRQQMEQATANNSLAQARITSAKQIADAERKKRDDDKDAAKAAQDRIRVEKQLTNAQFTGYQQQQKAALATANLTDHEKILVAQLKEKQKIYAGLYTDPNKGAAHPETQAALQDMLAAQKQVDAIGKASEAAEFSISAMGKSLTTAFGYLRNIAYVLPGIGIAGIFTLAGEAIEAAAKALLDFGVDAEKVREDTLKYIETLSKISGLISSNIELREQFGSSAIIESEKRFLKVEQDLNYNFYLQQQRKEKILELESHAAKESLLRATGVANENDAYTTQLVKVDKIGETLRQLQQEQLQAAKDVQSNVATQKDIEYYQERIEQIQQYIDVETKFYNAQKKILDDIDDARKKAEELTAQRAKFEEDERKARQANILKNETDNIIALNQIRQNAARSSEQVILNSLKNEKDARDRIINAERDAVLFNSKGQANLETAEEEKNTAIRNAQEKRLENQYDYEEKSLRITDSFTAKNLQSRLNIYNEEAEARLKLDEGIYKDENRTFEDRLGALSSYVENRKRQLENQYNYEKSLQSYSYKTELEKQEVETKYLNQIIDLQALTAGKIREVVTNYSTNFLRNIRETNKSFEDGIDVQVQYTRAMTELNNRYEEGSISYKKFIDERKRLQQSGLLAADIDAVEVAKQKVLATTSNIALINTNLQQSLSQLTLAEATKRDETEVRNARAKYEELLKLGKSANAELAISSKELADAELKYSEDKNKGKLALEEQLRANIKKIGEELIGLAQDIVDASFEKRVESVERNIELIDKQYDHEIEAIQRSSLASRDKTALDIQLQAQKERADEEADKRVRRLRHDQAVADKAFTMARIVWDTEQAIVGALTLAKSIGVSAVPLSISFGILGAIALSRAAAQPVPALAEGTENWVGGLAKVGEAGNELVKEPGKMAYHVTSETIKYLPKGTVVVPTYDIPNISERQQSDGWAQTKWLAYQFAKNQNKSTSKIVNNINIDLSFEIYKQKILRG